MQNSPYFCVFKYARTIKQKVWNEAENRERDCAETLLLLGREDAPPPSLLFFRSPFYFAPLSLSERLEQASLQTVERQTFLLAHRR